MKLKGIENLPYFQIDSAEKKLNNEIGESIKNLKILRTLKKEFIKNNEWFLVYASKDWITIKITDIKKLKTIKKILKNIYNDDYKYKISNIGKSYGLVYINYIYVGDNKIFQKIDIDVFFESEEDLPKSITKNGKCHFEKQTLETDVFVCEVE